MMGKDMHLYDETTKLKTDETWDCRFCIVGSEQAPQDYGARICRYCGANNQDALIYIMRLEGQSFYKIGVSWDIRERRWQLQTASPFDIEVVRFYEAENFETPTFMLENMLHKMLQRFHVRRRWYSPDEAALATLLNEEKLFEAVWHYAKHGQVL